MTDPPHDGSTGPAVLVVEDSGFIVARIMRILRRAGCRVVGPVATLEEALVRSEGCALAGSTLGTDLRGGRVFAVAELLQERGVPFVFLTGYTSLGIPEAWQHVPRVMKPFTAPALLAAAADLVAGHPPRADTGVEPIDAGSGELDQRIADAVRKSRDLLVEGTIMREGTPRLTGRTSEKQRRPRNPCRRLARNDASWPVAPPARAKVRPGCPPPAGPASSPVVERQLDRAAQAVLRELDQVEPEAVAACGRGCRDRGDAGFRPVQPQAHAPARAGR